MTGESTPPPSGGGMTYALVGVALLAGAGGLWYCSQGPKEEPKAEKPVEPPAPPPRPSSQFADEFEVPEEEPDASAEPPPAPTKKRIVYVDRKCNGDIPREALMSVVGQNRRQVRACYERRLKVNNTLQGRLNVRVIVNRNGSVSQVRVGGSLRDSEVFSCVRELARRWKFPSPSKGACAEVSIPFSLTPRS